MTKVNVSHCYRPILWHSQAAVSKLEAFAEADDYDTTVNATLLGKYTAHTDSYIADCITKICANKSTNPDNLTASIFSIQYFDTLGPAAQKTLAMCINSGAQNADSGMGSYAVSPTDYDNFGPFFSRVIAAYHRVPLGTVHKTVWSLAGVEGLPADGKLDLEKLAQPIVLEPSGHALCCARPIPSGAAAA